MFYTFKSVDRKVKIIQKRWKAKYEVNKARQNFLNLFWENELSNIHVIFDQKENKSKLDKRIVFQVNYVIRDEIIKDYYNSCIKTYNLFFKMWHDYHK